MNAQIIDAARKHPSGAFSYEFDNAYTGFRNYLFVFGGGAVSGIFTGTVRHEDGMMYIQGNADYQFRDQFTDPTDERENTIGTSDPAAATQELLDETEYGGTYYDITGEWRTRLGAEAKADEKASRYRWE